MEIRINEKLKTFELHYDNEFEIMGITHYTVSTYNPISKKVPHLPKYIDKKIPIYVKHEPKLNLLTYKLGFIYLIYLRFRENLTQENRDHILGIVKWNLFDELRPHINNLNDKQIEDTKTLLNYRLGITQIYTGYGKTEVISTLGFKMAMELGYRVLFITSGSSAKGELEGRVKKLFDYDCSDYVLGRPLNCINANGFFTSHYSNSDEIKDDLKSVDIVIMDEVETCMTPGMMSRMDNELIDRKAIYGFSATSNKVKVERLAPGNPSYLTAGNHNLVSYLGYSLVFEKPSVSNKQLTITEYRSGVKINAPKLKDYPTTYVRDNLLMTPKFAEALKMLGEDFTLFGTVLVPINSKRTIQFWIDNLRHDHNILYLRHGGYLLYRMGQDPIGISVTEAKLLVKRKEIKFFFCTRSGYNALDFDGIPNVMLVMREGNVNSVIQSIGRSREYATNVIYIKFGDNVPNYDSKIIGQLDNIKLQYENTNLRFSKKHL